MSGANVQVDAIRDFRVALVKFMETSGVAISDADGEVHRTIHWLELEQVPYWTQAIRRRGDVVMRWKDAVRQKQLFKDSTGSKQSAVDELKKLKLAEHALAEAQDRYTATKQYLRKLQKQQLEYRGQVQKLQLVIAGDLRECLAKLQALMNILAEYANTEATTESRSMAQDPPTIAPPPTEPIEPTEPMQPTEPIEPAAKGA